jgi:putative transposase
MADRVVPVDVRAAVVAWPEASPRGAVTRFCRDQGVSRSWFYEVRKRAVSEPALEAMQPRGRTGSQRHPQAIPVAVEDLAVQIRKDLADQGLDHGPVTVRWHLQQAGLRAPAASTLARVFSARGMVTAQPQKRPKASYRRFSFTQAHECWQLDSFQWPLADETIVAVFQLSDDCTRYQVASHVARAETSQGAMIVVERGICAFQVPLLLLTDNGAAFNRDRIGRGTQLVTHLRRLGCKPITGRPYHPQTQGKNERVHQTAQRWLRARPAPTTIADLQDLIEEFDQVYNHHRPHQALGMQTPAQALSAAVVAIPPQPVQSPRSGSERTQLLRRHADHHGKISVNYAAILLGWEHAHTEVAVLASGHSLSIFTTGGDLIRTVVLEPGKTYYSNGRPRGARSHRTQVSTLT